MIKKSQTSTTIDQRLIQIKTKFVVTIVVLATVSVSALAIALYTTNAISFKKDISPQKIESLVKDYPAVTEYIGQQKKYEAHFITLANLVKSDQQRLLSTALAYTVIPVLATTLLVSFLVAHALLRPIKESFDSQEQFLQDAAHELRNPLAALYAVVQEAKNQPRQTNSLEVMGTIERQVKQVVKLNEDLLALEKAKTATPYKKRSNISDLTHDVLDGLTFKANSLHIELKTKISPNVYAKIREEDWVRICNNLIDNAIKYSKPKTTVLVELQKNKKHVTLIVSDTGVGIPKGEVKKIGDRFYRGSNSGRVRGTGLGVAIVKQITSSYKGTFNIRSEQNKGTTVTVEL